MSERCDGGYITALVQGALIVSGLCVLSSTCRALHEYKEPSVSPTSTLMKQHGSGKDARSISLPHEHEKRMNDRIASSDDLSNLASDFTERNKVVVRVPATSGTATFASCSLRYKLKSLMMFYIYTYIYLSIS